MGCGRGLVNFYRPAWWVPGKGKTMTSHSFGLLAALLLLPVVPTGLARAQTPATSSATAPKAEGTQSAQKKTGALVVLNARGAQLAGKTLWLDGVSASAIVFADRPIRRAGYMHTPDLVKLWSAGSFAKSPPNATISAFAKDGSRLTDAVVVLKSPQLTGDRLIFHVAVLEGDLGNADGPASIFIDTIWFGAGGDNGVHYLGHSQTTGGTSPAFGSKHDTSNPSGWPNPSPNGTPAQAPPSPPNQPPLTTPPGTR
jgi:hypothetical protein